MNKSLVLIKPDGVKRHLIGEIIKRFEDKGLEIVAMEMIKADEEILIKHYRLDDRQYVLTLGHTDIEGKSEQELEAIYQRNSNVIKKLQEFMQSGLSVKMILQGGDDTVPRVRQIVGKTNPIASDKGTIRGDLGEDSFEQADKENRAVYNLVHASGTDEEAEIEIKLWFPYFTD